MRGKQVFLEPKRAQRAILLSNKHFLSLSLFFSFFFLITLLPPVLPVIRDGTGSVQVYADAEDASADSPLYRLAGALPDESVVAVRGELVLRPVEQQRAGAGRFEVRLRGLRVLSRAGALPFPVALVDSGKLTVDEQVGAGGILSCV